MGTPVPFSLMVVFACILLTFEFKLMFRFCYTSIFIVLAGIARKIASAGYGVFALDYPGFGLSEGLHGYIPSFDTLVDDVAETFAKVKGIPPFYYCWFLVLSIYLYKLLGNGCNVVFVFLLQRYILPFLVKLLYWILFSPR